MRKTKQQKKFEKLNPQLEFLDFKDLKKAKKIFFGSLSFVALAVLHVKGYLPARFREEKLNYDEIVENIEFMSDYDDRMGDSLNALIGSDRFKVELINRKKELKIGIQKKLYDTYGDNVEKAVEIYNDLFEQLDNGYHLSCEVMDKPLGYDIVVIDDILEEPLFEQDYVMNNISLNNPITAKSHFNTIMIETSFIEENSFYAQENYLTGALMHEIGHALFNIQDNDEKYNLWSRTAQSTLYNKFTHFDIVAIASKTMDLKNPNELIKLQRCLNKTIKEFKEDYPHSSYTVECLEK